MTKKIAEHIEILLHNNSLFKAYLGKEATNFPPAFNLFKQLTTENIENNANAFDLKLKVIMPLVNAIRLLALDKKQVYLAASTQRLDYLISQEENNREIFQAIKESFVHALYLRTKYGLMHQNSGRFLNLKELNKSELLLLKSIVKNLQQLQEALEAGATSILLDNFSLDLLHEAVRMNNSAVKKAILEASGGITLNNVHEVAKTGVDRISIGAITKDINAIDLSMQIIPNT